MKRLLKHWPLFSLTVLAVVTLSCAACGGGNDNNGTPTPKAGGTAAPAVTKVAIPTEVEKNGVTDSEIKIGTLLPMSNTTATAWGIPLSNGMKAYFDWINDQGGIYGRKLTLDIGDSQYTGPVSSEAARSLVEQDKVFAMMGGLGTEAQASVFQYLQENGVPDMFLLTGETMFTEPIASTRFAFLVDYMDEGRILGQYIGKTYPGKKLGILAQNDDFGKEGEQGIKQGIEGANMQIAETQYYDATQTDVTAQMQRLQADNVDVVGFYGMPAQAAGGIKTARTTLNWNVPFVITGVDAAQIVGALAGYDNIQGTVTVSFGHQSDETDVPGVVQYQELLAKYTSAKPDSISLSGYAVAEAMVRVLIQAGPNLTRSSFLAAAETICNFNASTGIAPESLSPTDHNWNQQEIFVKATGTTADTFSWKPFGDVIAFDSTKNCTPVTPPPDATKQPQTGTGG
jgi:ABC-type branched-subunit amino acid transport system substrate-binding protein